MTTSICRAKDPSICSYHQRVYGNYSATELKAQLDKEKLRAEVSNTDQARNRFEYMNIILTAQHDATEQGYAELDSEHARYSSVLDEVYMNGDEKDDVFDEAQEAVEELEEKLKTVSALRSLRMESQQRLDVTRNAVDARAGSAAEKKVRLLTVLKKERHLLVEEEKRNGFADYSPKSNAYAAVLHELQGFIRAVQEQD